MWVVKGKTVAGKEVEYKVPAGKDTEKTFVMALAFQEHGKASPEDALTAEVDVVWSSDSVTSLPTPIDLMRRENFGVDRRVEKGVWERFSSRAYRTIETATEALESAASENPNDHFRIVKTVTSASVISVSKNSLDLLGKKPDKPEEGQIEGQTKIEVKEEAKPKATPEPAAKAKPNAA